MTPAGWADDLADRLNRAGVRATTDPGKLAARGVLIPPPEVDLDLNCGGTATFQILCLSQLADRGGWWAAEELVTAVLPHLEAPSTVSPTTFQPADDVAAYRGFAISCTVNVEY